MENGPFVDDFPIKTSIYKGFSMAMLVITRWYLPGDFKVFTSLKNPTSQPSLLWDGCLMLG
jgi:uncharacterized membrane protein